MCPPAKAPTVGVAAATPQQHDAAAALAARWSLPLSDALPFTLAVTAARVELRDNADHRAKPVYVDFSSVNTRPGPGASRRQPIARAVGLRRDAVPPRVLDMTAGFGADAWLLAALGCHVTMIERHAVVAALLADGLSRAGTVDPDTAARLTLEHRDACRLEVDHWRGRVDVAYLDPMFPPRGKAALEKRPMRVLRQIVGADDDAAALLELARRIALKRIVVKRPRHAAPLAPDPVAMHEGKAMRYDVYRPASPA